MRLIRSIQIENLRSIQNQTLSNTGSLNAFVGRNSSGKSNILRALNLFFNGEIERGKTIDFLQDHYEQKPRIKKKKRIAITVEFELPPNFRLRKELKYIEALGKSISITRAWTLDQFRMPQESYQVKVNGKSVEDSADIGRQFLTLVTFRYIPHRTIPAAILKEESQAISNFIFSRMKGNKHGHALLEDLTNAAERMLSDAGKSLKRAGAPLSNPSVSTPEDIAEMLTMSGFRAQGEHGADVSDDNWGAGHQSFFLYQVLCALDTNYGQFFGWKQATIWGIEEPEAALHRDLETKLADQFREWSLNEDLKLQIFTTTHSPIFSMASDNGYWVELSEKASRFSRLTLPELVRAAEERGVSGWVHPVLYYPWNPVVLVEGHVDETVLNHIAKLSGLDNLRFISLPILEPSERRAGKDKIIAFLKQCRGMIQNRPLNAPFIVLFDWDVSDQDIAKAKEAYGDGAERFVFKMNEKHCDCLLGKEFKGIERFYPRDVILQAYEAEEILLAIPKGKDKPYSISIEELKKAKEFLRARILKINSVEKLKELLQVVVDVTTVLHKDKAVQVLLPGIEASADGQSSGGNAKREEARRLAEADIVSNGHVGP
jgi:energy-coupling factor transporter ATP-binding protein EcfA2